MLCGRVHKAKRTDSDATGFVYQERGGSVQKRGSGMSGGTGRITTEYTVWCSQCVEWLQEAGYRRKASVTKYFQSLGWKKIKGKFVCPNCVNKSKVKK